MAAWRIRLKSRGLPRYHCNKEAWRNIRERVIGNASQIILTLFGFVIVSEDEESIESHF